jgi:hypothetical protein
LASSENQNHCTVCDKKIVDYKGQSADWQGKFQTAVTTDFLCLDCSAYVRAKIDALRESFKLTRTVTAGSS